MAKLAAVTVPAVLAFIEEVYTGKAHRTTLDAALWWVAYREAQMGIDSNTAKDWAELFRDGLPGLKTEKDLEVYLEAGDEEDSRARIEADLLEFFTEG